MTDSTILGNAPKLQDFSLEAATQLVQEFKGKPGSLIEALHALQRTFGYLDETTFSMLGKVFNLSRAEVHGVASFYHDFRRDKPGKYIIKICQAEACQAMGSEALTLAAKSSLGCDFRGTSSNGKFTLEKVYCLGNCACAPNVLVGNRTYARMNSDKFNRLVETLTSNGGH
jgi:formate dehydrogenase subunit gamma